MKKVKVAAVQMGPMPSSITHDIDAKEINDALINGTASQKKAAKKLLDDLDIDKIHKHNFDRISETMTTAAQKEVELVVFPELSLTSFFPYFWMEDRDLLEKFFEIDNTWRKRIYSKAKELGVTVAFGYAQKERHNYNVFDLYSPIDDESHIYHKVHIPGFSEPRDDEETFQFEKKYFRPGDGYHVWDIPLKNGSKAKVGMIICHDRRYSNPYIIMGLRKVEIVLNGFNTPFYLTFNHGLDGDVYKFHYFPLQAQAITEGTYVISVARAGNVFGHKQIAGSCIIAPDGEILSKTEKLGEDIIYANIDLDWCRTVRDQKYQGERAEPEILYNDLKRYLNE